MTALEKVECDDHFNLMINRHCNHISYSCYPEIKTEKQISNISTSRKDIAFHIFLRKVGG